MAEDFWHKQEKGKPLFPKLEWSRPENRKHAGKLLIAGGNLHGFSAPAEAYGLSIQAGIGTTHVLLPDAIKKFVGHWLEQGVYVPSTPSGSIARSALVELLEADKWSDGVLFAGDLGRNSETAIILEQFLQKSTGITTLVRDAADYIIASPQTVLERPNTTLVLSLAQLQKLATAAQYDKPITASMDLIRLVQWLHEFSETYAPHIIVKHHSNILVAVNGEVSTTRLGGDIDAWRLKTATHATVWWLQNKDKAFEGMTAAVYSLYCV